MRSAYMPQPVTDTMAAGYLVIENDSDQPTTSPPSPATSPRTSPSTRRPGRRWRSADGNDLDVPAHGRLVLESGGIHMMFVKLKRKPKEGETVSVKLHFSRTSPITVEMPVKSATYQPTSTKSSASSTTRFAPLRE